MGEEQSNSVVVKKVYIANEIVMGSSIMFKIWDESD